jgi:very-short-patch-repair endonuclease
MNARAAIRAYGGLAATWQLHAAGVGRGALRVALQRREIVRVRQGWYAEARAHDQVQRAARVGGRITCASALDLCGYWVVADRALHVAVRPDRTQLRSSTDHRRRLNTDRSVRVHWSDHPDGNLFLTSPVAALLHYARCSSPELFAAAAESVIHQSRQLEPDVRALAPALPLRHRAALAAVDGVCESGTETLFRARIREYLTVPLRCQVPVSRVGDVDFVLGERLVVEVDGRRFHDTASQFERDRQRDAALSEQGFRVLRFSYRQVMSAWPTVERAVLAAVARGDAT